MSKWPKGDRMKLPLYTAEGSQTGDMVEASDAIFAIDPNDQAIYQAVVADRAHRRQGTHSTKTRSEVAGSGRKLYRQKGTGNARPGSIRTPVRVGGGRAFGPRPHLYRYAIPKKVKNLARRSALTYRAREEAGGAGRRAPPALP